MMIERYLEMSAARAGTLAGAAVGGLVGSTRGSKVIGAIDVLHGAAFGHIAGSMVDQYKKNKNRNTDPDYVRQNVHVTVSKVNHGRIAGWFFKKFFNEVGEENWDVKAVLDGEEIGFINIGFLPRLHRFCIYMIEVDPAYRRLGIASMMDKAAKDRFGTYVKSDVFLDDGVKFRGTVGLGKQPAHIDPEEEKKNPKRFRIKAESFMIHNYLEAMKGSTEIQPHQKRVKDKLDKSGAVLAYHGMGSGKTATSIYAMQDHNPDVIVPASLRGNYQKEIDKHTKGGHPHNIMSYEKASKMDKATSKALVMDEPQAIGHAETQRSRTLAGRGAEYERKLLLTGTPIRNHPAELAPLVNLLKGEKILPTEKKEFEAKYVQAVMSNPGFFAKNILGRKPTMTGEYQIKNAEELEKILDGHVDYHMPEQKNFPSKAEEVIKVTMSKDQQKMYNFALAKLNNPILAYKIRKGLPVSKQEAKDLNAFMSATRQISNTSSTYGGTEKHSPKIERAVSELVKRHEEDPKFRGMVYSNFLDSGLRNYKERLDQHGISNAIFDGSLSDKQREQVVNDYNSGKTKALLVSGAGAQGLDLKGTKLVQVLEPHWNSARTEQAKARAIRYKSHDHLPEEDRHVHVQTFHSTLRPGIMDKIGLGRKVKDKSADEVLDEMNERKNKLNNQFLDVLKKSGSK